MEENRNNELRLPMKDLLVELANFVSYCVPVLMAGLVAYQIFVRDRRKEDQGSSDQKGIDK